MTDTTLSPAVGDAADTTPVSGPRAGRFQKGNPGYGLRKAAGAREGPKVPSLLKAMREVALRSESKDRTQLQKECRQWLKESRSQFMAKMADMERAHLMALAKEAKEKPAAGGDEPPPPDRDVASERVEDLIDKLLADLGVQA